MKNLFPLIIISIILFSCSGTPKIAISNANTNSFSELTVEGKKGLFKKQSISFGDYQSTFLNRSWTKSNSYKTGKGFGGILNPEWARLVTTEYVTKKQSLYFEMSDKSNNQSKVLCLTNVKSQDLQFGKKNGVINSTTDILGLGDSESNFFSVQIVINDRNNETWELLLDNIASQRNSKTYNSYITRGRDEIYTIQPVNKLIGKNGSPVNMLFGSAGFEIKNKAGLSLAAVSIIGKGMIYLSDVPAEEKFLLANICTAILLREEI